MSKNGENAHHKFLRSHFYLYNCPKQKSYSRKMIENTVKKKSVKLRSFYGKPFGVFAWFDNHLSILKTAVLSLMNELIVSVLMLLKQTTKALLF